MIGLEIRDSKIDWIYRFAAPGINGLKQLKRQSTGSGWQQV
jgi:hypothetical protein